ncbi:MAG: hypothetical protein HKM89_06200 [Gemmatimonadales bacterium]|nr:hypothetical protein [Gemmatimonadales bacterium]
MTALALSLDEVVLSGAFEAIGRTALEILGGNGARPRVARPAWRPALPRKNYILLTREGERLGVIPVPERRPVLGRLEPTLFLRRPYYKNFRRSTVPESGSP